MELSRDDVETVARATAVEVLKQMHRYATKYIDPITIVDGLQDSMIEESTAATWYRRRAADARQKGDPTTAELYEHVAEEEDQHQQEFKDRLDIIMGVKVG